MPHGHPVVVGEGEFLQLAEALLAHVIGDVVLDPAGQEDEEEDDRDLQQDDRQVDQREGPEGDRRLPRPDVVVDRVACEQRHQHVGAGQDGHEQGNEPHVLPMPAHVDKEFSEQAEIEFLRVFLFFRKAEITHIAPPEPCSVPCAGCIHPQAPTGSGKCAGTGLDGRSAPRGCPGR